MKFEKTRRHLKIVTGIEEPPADLPIREALARLDAMAADESLPNDLAHYLSRRSYVKALECLDNPDMPHNV